MADQLTMLTLQTSVPLTSTLLITPTILEWQFRATGSNQVLGTLDTRVALKTFDIQLWCDQTNWLYGTEIGGVIIPVSTDETLTVRVRDGGSIFVRAVAGSGTLVSLYVN